MELEIVPLVRFTVERLNGPDLREHLLRTTHSRGERILNTRAESANPFAEDHRDHTGRRNRDQRHQRQPRVSERDEDQGPNQVEALASQLRNPEADHVLDPPNVR